ncbi:MAG: hypothetical protein ACJAWW_001288, partial [Sulfurimonas sp.]
SNSTSSLDIFALGKNIPIIIRKKIKPEYIKEKLNPKIKRTTKERAIKYKFCLFLKRDNKFII